MARKMISQTDFITTCIEVHGTKYTYEKTIYSGMRNKVIITCPFHGDFEQNAKSHTSGYGCSYCSGCGPLTKDIFITRSNLIHRNKYTYPNLNDRVPHSSTIDIICPEHGLFRQCVNSHVDGKGCQICANTTIGNKKRMSLDEFKQRGNETHSGRYSYDKVYFEKTTLEYVTITCKEHGDFTQIGYEHLVGKIGCSKCHNTSTSRGVKEISSILTKHGIDYHREYRFNDCVYRNKLPFDFYLPEHRTCIEFDGEQHFKIKEHWGGEKEFNLIQIRDEIKNKYCENNDISLYRIRYDEPLHDKMDYIIGGLNAK